MPDGHCYIRQTRHQWLPWFAWYPVMIKSTRRYTWLRKVMCKAELDGFGHYSTYEEPFLVLAFDGRIPYEDLDSTRRGRDDVTH